MPQSARLRAGGGGCNRHLGHAQIEVTFLSVGLPFVSKEFPSSSQVTRSRILMAWKLPVEAVIIVIPDLIGRSYREHYYCLIIGNNDH